MIRRFTASSLVAVAATWAACAVADTEQGVATARQLAIQGIEAVEGGDCDRGAPLLERAEKLHHASVHLQYLARCRVAAGRLVAATEMWRRIVRDGAPSSSSPAVHAAVSEATSELEKMLPRLARTTIRTAATYPGLELRLDGLTLPSELVGAEQVVDPGHHELTARAPGFAPWSHTWDVSEGKSADVTIELAPGEAGKPPPAQDAGPGEARQSGSPLATAGWITASAGGAALVAGTVTLLMRNNRRSEFYDHCPDKSCDPAYFRSQADVDDEADSIRALTTATNVLLFGGGALLATGVTLIVVGSASGNARPNAALLAGAPLADAGLTFRGRW